METNPNQEGNDAQLPKKTINSQMIITALIVVIIILAGTLFFSMKKNAEKEAMLDSKTSEQESVLDQNIDNAGEGTTASEESSATSPAVTDSSTSGSTAADSTSSGSAPEPKYPDLYIVKYDFSEEPTSGEEFTVNIKIGNKGNADADSFHWEWWATHAKKDCDGKVDKLAVGKTVTVGCKFTYSSWSTYDTKAVVDSKAEIDESNENNNAATKQVVPIHDTAKADLLISEYEFNHPPKSGEAFSVKIVIKNGGDAATGSFWWEWWPTWAGKSCRAKIDNLAAHAEKTVYCTYTYSSWSTYATKAVADADDDVSESNESNNVHTENVIPIH